MLSRQEELKERARLLLEQARRDAAMKAGNKNVPNSAVNVPNRATNVCDVSQNGVSVCVCACMDFSRTETVDTLTLSGRSIQWSFLRCDKLRKTQSWSTWVFRILSRVASLVSSVCSKERLS